MNKTTTTLLVLFLSSVAHAQVTYFVPDDYPTIQDALNAALDDDTIYVRPGVWHSSTVIFNGHDVHLISLAGSEFTTIEVDEDGQTGVLIALGETVTMQGFQIVLHGAKQAGITFDISGGSNVSLIDVHVASGGTQTSTGVKVNQSIVSMTDCSVFRGRVYAVHAAAASSLTLTDCHFETSTSNPPPCAVMRTDSSTVTATRCTFDGRDNTDYAYYNTSGVTEPHAFIDCLFTNTSFGVRVTQGSVTLTGCTIAGNSSLGLFMTLTGGHVATVTNTIIWDNPISTQGVPLESSFSYSCIEGAFPGMDFSISTDPLFANPKVGNYRLGLNSPCIDLGNNAGGNSDFDLSGNIRYFDDPGTPDCPQPGANCGLAPVVDMGAYDFRLCTTSDFDDDGFVGISAFLFLLAAWGTPDADATGDGDTGIDDFLLLLSQWGPCS